MGYNLHIVRRNDWDDFEEESNISLEEWLTYVRSDDELDLTNGYEVKIPGTENSFQNVPGFCNWTGHTTKATDNIPWFDYGNGMISTKYPDDETIKKMIAIAEKLNAKVQGDDDEFYDINYFLNRSNKFTSDATNRIDKKSWWKFW
ncbi:hypothetical protein GCM10027036_18330 [Flavihumibacter cheonanensis]|jgi:hypothetical protein|uniref:Uncharacterized protein n=1 Tax=Flavihumibacter fluminis TaxID=2909236 RepID=A0ABS9BMX2_9BACT|nr:MULTISPECIES: hypothetical protein [Flavihumibacter]MCF1717074.1 hypothetical protein [Flavihumibacter fluminis]MCG7753967.1 hypothetical protein [Flavihumibacter cheonanensis]